MKHTLLPALLVLLFTSFCFAQEPDEEEDYSQYGSVEEGKKYCTQKVRRLSPTKLISVGFEMQAPFAARFDYEGTNPATSLSEQKINFMGGARLMSNNPVISNNRFILNLGANYYESFVRFDNSRPILPEENPRLSPLKEALGSGLRTMGLNLTAFKPLDEKRFLILSAMSDYNGNFGWNTIDEIPMPTGTFGALYGWKKDENTQFAIGATQTWRGGEKLYVPLLMYNKTFNDKWGLEMLLPARAHVRYNFSAQSLLLAGFEIEGNSYRLGRRKDISFPTQELAASEAIELRRSELKFRAIYERKLFGFVWLSAQAGWRYNFKFNFSEARDSKRGEFLYTSKLGNPLYGAISINLVSP
jgi:hypothetical protein